MTAQGSSKYSDAYKSLNQQQRRAVDHIEGPLLVIAGPGTGKTQLLSMRASNILLSSDAAAENILCLTFTDKAATNMRERMLELIGPEARKIAVHTFHGLGAEIIAANSEYFWNGAHLSPAPEATKIEVIESELAKLPPSSRLALKFEGHYTQISDAKDAIEQAKKAGLTPDKLKAVLDANLAYIDKVEDEISELLAARMSKAAASKIHDTVMSLPDQELTQAAPIPAYSKALKRSCDVAYRLTEETGKITSMTKWKDEVSRAIRGKRMMRDRGFCEWWLELVAVYRAYQKAMAERRQFDFSDMILETITQLESSPELLSDLQERYTYIMIDEFQDTNDAQFRLAHLIANHPIHEGRPNIMAVGDDDQAIYRFQGASLGFADTFRDTYREVEIVALEQNYRSHQNVIDQSRAIRAKISHPPSHSGGIRDKHIISASSSQKGTIEHICYPTKEHQNSAVVEMIKQHLPLGDKTVAVLSYKHGSLRQLASIMSSQAIPVRYTRSSNVLEHEAVKAVIDILALLEHIRLGRREQVDRLLSELLPHPMWRIDPRHLWQFAIDQSRRGDWLGGLMEHKSSEFSRVGELIGGLGQIAASENISILIEYVIGLRVIAGMSDSPIKTYYLEHKAGADSYVRLLSAIGRLRSLADEFAVEKEADLAAFNRFIRINRQYDIVIADESAFVTDERAIDLMTVHGAKGLEYDTVYIIDAIDKVWRPSSRHRRPPMNLHALRKYGEDSDDYARLMYVAATRAKSDLVVCSFDHDESGGQILPTPLVMDIPMRQAADDDMISTAEVLERAITWPLLDHDDMRMALASRLESYEMPVTHLINFLDLSRSGPQTLLERNLLRLPEVKKPALAYGTAMHEAMRQTQLMVNSGSLSIDKVLKAFEVSLGEQHLTKLDYERYADQGRAVLERLLRWDAFEPPKGSDTERAFHNVRLGEARLGGELDRVDHQDQGITVVDYKTGKPLATQLTTESKSADGLKAWRLRTQLTFYHLLMRHSGSVRGGSISGRIVYLEAEDERDLSRDYTPSARDIERLEQLVQAVWRHVIAVDLPDVNGYSQDLIGIQSFEQDLIDGRV